MTAERSGYFDVHHYLLNATEVEPCVHDLRLQGIALQTESKNTGSCGLRFAYTRTYCAICQFLC
jgi:hypothetical protein